MLGREPSKEDRNRAKAVNFGFLYGMGAAGFKEYAKNSYGVDVTDEKPRGIGTSSSRPTPDCGDGISSTETAKSRRTPLPAGPGTRSVALPKN